MVIGERLRFLRESKNMSQGDVEKRTGLLRCYLSRVENGHTVPALETLEKLAGAFEVPLYQLFYEGKNPPKVPEIVSRVSSHEAPIEGSGKDAKYLRRFRKYLAKINDSDRQILLTLANKIANR